MDERWSVHLWHWIGFLVVVLLAVGGLCFDLTQAVLLLFAALPGAGLIIFLIKQRKDRAALREREAALKRQQAEFAQNVNHELRHPLTLVLGCVDLLSEGSLDREAQRRMFKTLHRHTHDLVARVEMITAFSELPRQRLNLEPVDIYELVKSALRTASEDACRAGVTFHLDRQTGPSVTVGDASWLSLALRYLFDNAIKFSPDGGPVHVRLYTTGDEICVEVADSGVGIAPSQIRQIFEPFQQGDGSATRRFGGVGLGLTVARRVAEGHDGRLSVKSDGKRKGSTFTLSLPMVMPVRMTEPALMFQVAHERWDGRKTTSPGRA